MKELTKSLEETSLEELINILRAQEQLVDLLEKIQEENKVLDSVMTRVQNQNTDLKEELERMKAEQIEREEEMDELSELNIRLNNENSRLNKEVKELEKQIEIYKKASDTTNSIKAIIYFTDSEYKRINKVLSELGLNGSRDVVLIDARKDNKQSASIAK